MSNSQINHPTPLVSILLPTHNRPDYFETALKSALAQTYGNFEVVVSDNGDNELTSERIQPYLQKHKNLIYFRKAGMTALENWDACFKLSKGEYINYLMDDDVFHPEKLSRMVAVFLANPKVGLVTSYRELIDSRGGLLPPLRGTERLFTNDTLVSGETFGKFILLNGINVIGEPTTAMVRRADIPRGFGFFGEVRYKLMSDVATWLSVLSTSDCAYLSEPLSHFRIHDGQDQKSQENVRVNASIEWFNLLFDSIDRGWFFKSSSEYLDHITRKIPIFKEFILQNYQENSASMYSLEDVNKIFERAKKLIASS